MYDWKPVQCYKCSQLGHMEDTCRVGQSQPTKPSTMPILETLPDVTPVIDEDGFQEVRGRHPGKRGWILLLLLMRVFMKLQLFLLRMGLRF